MPMVIKEVSIDWLTVHKMIITEVGKQCYSLGSWDRCAMETIAYIEHKLDLTRQMKSRKNTNKG